MYKPGFHLASAFLFLSMLPLGCVSSSDSPKGSGGRSPASGGSGGISSVTGGKSGSGGSSEGGASEGNGGDSTGGSGGGGGTSPNDAWDEAPGGNSGDAGDGSGDDTSGDGSPVNEDIGGTCTDRVQSDLETDVDCGGGTCPKCGAGLKCKTANDCRNGKCEDSGKCADSFAATGTVTNNNGSNIWSITLGTVILEVDSSSTGMVSLLTLDGTDLVAKYMANNGSVFWTSPQSAWYTDGTTTWPPPNEMSDGTKYTPSSKNNILTMTGPVGSTDKLSISKRYWGNVDNQAITIEYTIHNTNAAAVSKAPWEITRLYAGGLTFFPSDEEAVSIGDSSFLLAPMTSAEGVLWFNDKATSYTSNVKGGANGLEGWAAHIVCGTGLKKTCASTSSQSPVLIKEWSDVLTTEVVTGEKEVEIFVDQSNTYEELEQQGAYVSIPAGGTLVWTMHWLIRYLPSAVKPTSGSADLLTWVRGELL
jgi:hypothetical protein